MSKKTIILFLFVLPSLLAAQFLKDAEHFLGTGKDLSLAIWKSDTQSRLYFLAGTAGIIGLSFLDEGVQDYALSHRSPFKNDLFKIDDYYGNKWYMIGGMGAIYFGGLLTGHEKIRETGLLTAEAYFYTSVLTVVTKEIFGRSRPYLEDGPYTFNPFSFKESKRSFFSGHSSTVFAVSTVMASRIDNVFWKAGWYTAAVLTGTARMYHDKHWLSDVTAGAIVGCLIGNFVVKNNDSGSKRTQLIQGMNENQNLLIGFRIQLN